MVKKLGLFFSYILFFILMLLFFAPKISLYYLGEAELKKSDLIISGESVYDRGFTLEVEDATIYMKSIESAKLSLVSVDIFLLYNKVAVEGVTLSKTLKSFLPLHIESIEVQHSIFNPTNIVAEAHGEFGDAEVVFDLVERALHVKMQPSSLMLKEYKTTLREFSKDEDGGYSYDANL